MNISQLTINFKDKTIVDIDLKIQKSLALVGESGSGKSLTIKALLNMLPQNFKSILKYDANFKLNKGDTISFVPQNPFTALSPLTKIKNQFFVSQERVKELFTQVNLDTKFTEKFPSQLSGGQLQRVVIAIALEKTPKLLLLDEPTTALDPNTRVIILNLLKRLQKELNFKILFVTHDINSAKLLCQDIAVIKDGKIIEDGKMSEVLKNPQDQYTKILIEANFANRKFRQ